VAVHMPMCQPDVTSALDSSGASPGMMLTAHSGKSGGGLRCCVACSYAYARRIKVGSSHGRPTNCSPSGNPENARTIVKARTKALYQTQHHLGVSSSTDADAYLRW